MSDEPIKVGYMSDPEIHNDCIVMGRNLQSEGDRDILFGDADSDTLGVLRVDKDNNAYINGKRVVADPRIFDIIRGTFFDTLSPVFKSVEETKKLMERMADLTEKMNR